MCFILYASRVGLKRRVYPFYPYRQRKFTQLTKLLSYGRKINMNFHFTVSVLLKPTLIFCMLTVPSVAEFSWLEVGFLHGLTGRVMMSASQCTVLFLQTLIFLRDSPGEHIARTFTPQLICSFVIFLS